MCYVHYMHVNVEFIDLLQDSRPQNGPWQGHCTCEKRCLNTGTASTDNHFKGELCSFDLR